MYFSFRLTDRLHVFPRLAEVTSVFSRAKHQRHVFARLAPVTSFPAFGAGYMFSRPKNRLHVFPRFPRLAPFASFPALGTCCMSCPQILIGSMCCLTLLRLVKFSLRFRLTVIWNTPKRYDLINRANDFSICDKALHKS